MVVSQFPVHFTNFIKSLHMINNDKSIDKQIEWFAEKILETLPWMNPVINPVRQPESHSQVIEIYILAYLFDCIK